MNDFLSAKRWEAGLALLTVAAIPLLDAYEAGAFHGKSLVEGAVVGLLILARAAASHRQSPPAA